MHPDIIVRRDAEARNRIAETAARVAERFGVAADTATLAAGAARSGIPAPLVSMRQREAVADLLDALLAVPLPEPQTEQVAAATSRKARR